MSEVEIKKLSQSQWLLMAVVICLLLAALISLREILMPFAIGALIAYLGDPLVDRLEERGFSRTNGVMIVFGLFLGLLVLVIAVVAPLLFKQLSELAAAIPEAYRWLSSVAVPKLQAWLSLTPINLPELDWRTSLSEHWTSVGKVTGGGSTSHCVESIAVNGIAERCFGTCGCLLFDARLGPDDGRHHEVGAASDGIWCHKCNQ